MQAQHIGFLAAFVATMIWSGNFIVARLIAGSIAPIELSFWRWTVATLVILPFTIKSMRREWTQVWKHRGYIIFMAFTGISAMGTVTYIAGQSTSSINMSLLAPCSPIFMMLLARIIFGEPITPRRLYGMIIVIVGILSIISKGNITNILDVQFSVGDIWIIGAAMMFALYSLYVRRCPTSISLATFNGFTFLTGTLIIFPFVLIDYIIYGIPTYNKEVFISIMYTGIGCSALAYVLWAKAISIIGTVKASFIYYTLPFFTATSAFLFLGESITFASVIGGICIIAGILVATLERKLPIKQV